MWAMPCGTCFRSFFLNVFFLPFLSGAAVPVPAPAAAAGFAIIFPGPQSLVVPRPGRGSRRPTLLARGSPGTGDVLSLGRRLLLLCDRALARTLPGARVGVGPLPAHRQVPAMPVAAVGTDLDEALDIHRNFLAQ